MKIPKHLSYSALTAYADCGERYRLERGYKLSDSTWWATLGGSAVHEITEAHDRKALDPSVVIPDFEMTLDKYAAQARAKGQEIKASGRVTEKIGKTGGPNKKDREWWLHWGPLYIQAWNDWREANRYRLAVMPDGTPGVEVSIRVSIGGKQHIAYIDRVFVDPLGYVVIVDLKTGKEPLSGLQLGSYGVALRRQFGIDADLGAFWMADKGELSTLVDLSAFSDEFVDEQYAMAARGIEAGIFLASPSSFCSACPVRSWCRTMGGRQSVTIPVREVMEVTAA